MITIKRVYEDPLEKDGYRVLVDRLWPRGLKKETAAIDQWCKEVAPSTALRKWFNHDVKKWKDFETRYRAELQDNESVDVLKIITREHPTVTLLFAAKDTAHNQAVVLQQFLKKK